MEMAEDNPDEMVAAQIRGCVFWGTAFGIALAATAFGAYAALVSRSAEAMSEIRSFAYLMPIFVNVGFPIGVEAYKKRRINVSDAVATEIQKSLTSSIFLFSMAIYLLLWIVRG
jgi:hypothetical protein